MITRAQVEKLRALHAVRQPAARRWSRRSAIGCGKSWPACAR